MAMDSPTIFTNPLSTPRLVTIVSLSPTARSRNPDLVLMYQSKRYFATMVIRKIMITFLKFDKKEGVMLFTKLLLKIFSLSKIAT